MPRSWKYFFVTIVSTIQLSTDLRWHIQSQMFSLAKATYLNGSAVQSLCFYDGVNHITICKHYLCILWNTWTNPCYAIFIIACSLIISSRRNDISHWSKYLNTIFVWLTPSLIVFASSSLVAIWDWIGSNTWTASY